MSADEPPLHKDAGVKTALAAGGILAALGAASCCVLPFAFFVLGVSGAWIGNLTALEPYQPLFLAAAAGFLGAGFWKVYRRRITDAACAEGDWCARPESHRITKIGLWAATVLAIVAVAFPRIAPLFLGNGS